jgi:hypothetical protein
VVPRGWHLTLDELGNFLLEDKRPAAAHADGPITAQATA